ncbi:MAG: DUF87 domain-containing protein [Candidatus Brennerbacteria bacterium]|nr:DUF87 domain-containing protein [Candidatus Brennerbacteria bacterium]
MSRNNKNGKNGKNGANNEEKQRLHPDVKKSVLAIILLGISVLMILSAFNEAGPAGQFFYSFLSKLFGWGYYIWPMTLFISACVMLSANRARPFPITVTAAVVFIAAGLGIIDINFPQQGGFTGSLIGAIKIPFGYPASLVILTTFLAAAFIIMLNWPIKISWNRLIAKKEQNNNDTQDQQELTILNSTAATRASVQTPAQNYAAETESKTEDHGITKKEYAETKTKPFKAIKMKDYVPPPIDLLKSSSEKPTIGDLRANANIIKRTLESFGIPVEMGEISVGPAVTRYTLKPAEGVKISRITALNQDLALALAAHPIRIEAPIPGKSLVGIEVPNKSAALVRLGNLMAYPEFAGSGPLGFIIGRDVSGTPIFSDIAKMPHLLIAGATGSGKSVTIHSLLISLLYKNSPATLKMILIDPKRVELSVYEGMPHLVAPVVTENKKTLSVFRWAVQEMEHRYELLLEAGARDIKSYNVKTQDNPLPYLLLVIDELADLMASYGREVEGSIIRLAQMARATGIHLVVSTQRPSVEVITGLIKANITSRIALQVASQVDSRTILDTAGAEKLLGSGDLLFISPDFSKPKRIQAAYISEEEINKVTDFIRENNKIVLETNGQSFEGADSGAPLNNEIFDEAIEEEDELYDEAVKIVTEAQKASASLLQRRLKVGYARAARLLDIMEAKGLISPGDGAKPREVFLNKDNNNDY